MNSDGLGVTGKGSGANAGTSLKGLAGRIMKRLRTRKSEGAQGMVLKQSEFRVGGTTD